MDSTKQAITSDSSPILQMSNLNVYYGESHIIRDLDISVPLGRMVCLIGRNGVGKTTLLKTIMGLLKPRSGTIKYAGKLITNLATHRRAKLGIGYVPQGREIIPRLSVKENLLLGLEALPGRKKEKQEIPEEILELFPALHSMLERRGGDLSGGQQQQLAIARTLMGKPKLLVLDEPTEGIQPSIVLVFLVLLVEQHLHFLRQADKYYAMQKGGIVASGATSELSQEVIQKFLAV